MSKVSAKDVFTIALPVALALVAFGNPAAADEPVALPFFQQFVDTNPCTGEDYTVTVTGTAFVHDHDGVTVITVDRHVTTSDGFEGGGTSTFVNNGQIQKISLRDILESDSGARIRAGFVLVIDLSSGTMTAFNGAVSCLGA